MSKFKTMVLMLCLVLSAALSYAHGVTRTDKEEGSHIIANGYYYDENTMLTEEEILGNEYVKEEAKAEIVKDLEKKTVALSAENLAEVFPDAVRTDPDNRLGINYNAVITILTEAVKQQQSEIELLRNTLEDNGLLEPEEP